ncbi:DegT/DnrJ/EryC1/StrS aminotransferase family protein [Planomicrobium sp. YIM 101495]|uniref:DegT/DnrJ/EryC1/StrS family aminotransferase n=1 Tax=Planomicrobium sp. YIM 101495 TaxID=2665160 RepID=UPI0012B6D9DB|nr:DegT/DnrJ/EryC1/StrS family aminotransferase [Planomicrobium sp. YIM 101495]MTD30565.1 aminotransferase class I/II-fold pyridoxal phosphate-dependent enzyme [Planomicrobium sp. YIM 101495]
MEGLTKPVYVTKPLLPALDGIVQRLEDIWESGQMTNQGGQHELLQKELKLFLGIDRLELFNNGTIALLLGLKALGLSGEVITTPFTFPATVQALDWNGLTPVFCDIRPDTLNIDPKKIEALITEKTTAILGVHVFGNLCDVERIQEIADKYNLKVIYDGAHVFGTKSGGVPVANYGDMTMFSFHATKLFHTVEGGALAFKDERITEVLRMLRNFGITGPDQVALSGLNGKMNELQAAVGLEVLPLVERERKKRQRLKELYERELTGVPGLRIITNLEGEESSYQYFVIEIDEAGFGCSRNDVHDKLLKRNVSARKYFYPLCSGFEWYSGLQSSRPEHLPNAHMAVDRTLALPFYGALGEWEVERICSFLKQLNAQALIAQ